MKNYVFWKIMFFCFFRKNRLKNFSIKNHIIRKNFKSSNSFLVRNLIVSLNNVLIYAFSIFLFRNLSFSFEKQTSQNLHCQSTNSISIKATLKLYLKFSNELFTSREELFIDPGIPYKLWIAAEKSLREVNVKSASGDFRW